MTNKFIARVTSASEKLTVSILGRIMGRKAELFDFEAFEFFEVLLVLRMH